MDLDSGGVSETVKMKIEDFYHQLSRRDLQILCKKYGLPANKSHSEMANLLSSHIPNKYTHGQTSCSRMAFQNNSNGDVDGVKLKGPKRLKSSNDSVNPASSSRFQNGFHIQHRDSNGSLRPSENSFSLTVKSPEKGLFSSFEFHVRSDEGINLCVDLNSSPSEWASKLNSECTEVLNDEDQCLQMPAHTGESTKQTGDSCLGIKDDDDQFKYNLQQIWHPPITPARETTLVEFSPLNGTGNPLGPLAVIPCNMVDNLSKHLEDKVPVSFHPDLQNHVYSASNSAVESFSNGPVCNVLPEHQNLYQNSEALRNDSFPGNCNVEVPGSSASSSMKAQLSEAATFNQDSRRLNKPGLAKLKELIPGNYQLYCTEETVKSEASNAKESSESSQHTLSDEYIQSRSDSIESNGVSSRRKQHMELPNGNNNKPDGKLSRSIKHQSGELIPRRSTRLFPKVTL